ncbi:hypothetical protein ACFXG4_04755 [Nocardia sp. NPDC059246]|uniref:hypothetical protein n=1 Tax=unclassified Nocardia TaxID=2637762 RepID=UPI0036B022D0
MANQAHSDRAAEERAPYVPDARTAGGMRSACDLIEAIHSLDVHTAEAIVNNCDAPPTIFAFAGMVLSLAEQDGHSVPDMLATLRAQIPAEGGAR